MNIKFTFAAGGGALALILFINVQIFSQALWQPAGADKVYTLRKTGIGTNNPTEMLDVNGRTKFRGNAAFDSLLFAWHVLAEGLHSRGNSHINGVLSVGSVQQYGGPAWCQLCGKPIVTSRIINIDGNTSSIISTTDSLNFGSNHLRTSGTFRANDITAINALNGASLGISGNAAVNGQLSTNNITSTSGQIDFGNNNLTTTGNISSSNIAALQTSADAQQVQITNLSAGQSVLSSRIDSIQPSPWATEPDGSITFAGTATVRRLNATDAINIGTFRFSNGGNQPPPNIIDSIRTPYAINISSGAQQISLDAGNVSVSNFVTFTSPGAINQPPPSNLGGQLNVSGNISAGGNISSSSLTSTSISTQQLTINGGSVRADTLRANNSLSVNHSLLLAKENTNNFAEVSTIDTSVALVLQNTATGRVGIGITPSIGEKLSVSGNVGVSGNLRLSNLSGSGDRQLVVDANGNLKTFLPTPLCFFNIGIGCGWQETGNAAAMTFFSPLGSPAISMTELGGNGPIAVGVGCQTPQYTLDVSGTVRAKEFRANLGGCDFVFEKNYFLMTLEERRKKVLFEKHLPNIASALEMQKGTDLGTFTLGLLQNIEEHEHYLYQQNDRMDKLEKENLELKLKLESLQKQIETLQKK